MLSGGEQRSDSAIVGGVAVLLTLLETSRLPLWVIKFTFKSMSFIINFFRDDSSDKNDEESTCQSSLCKAMVPRLKDLHDVLINPPKVLALFHYECGSNFCRNLQRAAIKTTAENLDPPFGNTRLQICRLISALIATQDAEILTSLAELGTVRVLLVLSLFYALIPLLQPLSVWHQDLFFTYKWNNFLHSQVEQCVALLLQSLSAPDAAPKSLYCDQTFTKSPGSSPSTPPPEIGDASDTPKAEDSAEDKGVNDKLVQEKVDEAQSIEPNPLVINVSNSQIFWYRHIFTVFV
jgi:SIT4 phosphatase-associated protein